MSEQEKFVRVDNTALRRSLKNNTRPGWSRYLETFRCATSTSQDPEFRPYVQRETTLSTQFSLEEIIAFTNKPELQMSLRLETMSDRHPSIFAYTMSPAELVRKWDSSPDWALLITGNGKWRIEEHTSSINTTNDQLRWLGELHKAFAESK